MPHSKFLPFILTILPKLRPISDWARTLLSSLLQMGHSIQVGATPLSWSQALPSPSSDYLRLHDLPYLLWTISDSAILCTSSGLSQTPQSSLNGVSEWDWWWLRYISKTVRFALAAFDHSSSHKAALVGSSSGHSALSATAFQPTALATFKFWTWWRLQLSIVYISLM